MAGTSPTRLAHRRHPSPSAELRFAEQMRVRLGMIAAMVLTLAAAAGLFNHFR